jgi:cytochrome c oxidase assembly protein subunit 15|tara:strand:- start:9179 stop:10180 length:1002 start_codon:yes stop_codon:yes gene_type:complete
MPQESTAPFPQRLLLTITGIAAALTFVVILLSAYIRLAEAGLGCSPWPACFAQFSSETQTQAQDLLSPLRGDYQTLRVLHRVSASIVTLLVLIIASTGFRYRAEVGIGIPAGILIFTALLTVLGVNTPTREMPLIAFGNLMGGIILLALLFWLVLRLLYGRGPATPPTSSVTYLTVIGRCALLAVFLQIASGGWASANYSSAACSGLFSCDHVNPSRIVSGFNPFRQLPLGQPEGILLDSSAASIMLVHHVAALLFSVVVSVCLYVLFRRARQLRGNLLVILVLLIATFSLGSLSALIEMPLWSGILHDVLSVLFLLATCRLTYLIQLGRGQH